MNADDNILAALAALQQNLKDIDSAKQQVTEVVQSSKDLANVIVSYKSSFEGLSSHIKQILDASKDLNLNVLSELSNLTLSLKDELSRLSEFDFDTKFQKLQQEALKQIEKDLVDRFAIIDTKARVLQEKADLLQKQVVRFESIDLDDQFDKLDKVTYHLSQQDQRFNNRFTEIGNLFIELERQHVELRKEIMTNRIIQIFGVAVIIITALKLFFW